jgi:hypothetical protein
MDLRQTQRDARLPECNGGQAKNTKAAGQPMHHPLGDLLSLYVKNLSEKMSVGITKKVWLKVGIILLGTIAGLLLLLSYPQPLFSWSVHIHNLSLYSDQAFSSEDGKQVLELAQAKLTRSALYSSRDNYAIFICNSDWRRMIFFFANSKARGLTYYPLSSNVFLSGAAIKENRLISPSGRSDILGRTLDHFIVHEITHILTGRFIGEVKLYYLPDWIKEGYAEYIGRGCAFNYDKAVQAFLEESPEMNVPPSVPYLRYTLIVTYLLEKQQWSLTKLFETSISQNEVETKLKAEALQESGQARYN